MELFNDTNKYPTWKNKYCLPFETAWSIREKYCALNAYSYQKYGRIERNVLANRERDVSTQYELIMKAAQFDKSIVSRTIRVCPLCLMNGYHSKWHQISLLADCFIHKNVRLISLDNLYTEHKQKMDKNTFEIQYRDYIVDIVDNERFREDIKSALRCMNIVYGIHFFDYSTGRREHQFGLNKPYESTKELFKTILFNCYSHELQKTKCIFQYDIIQMEEASILLRKQPEYAFYQKRKHINGIFHGMSIEETLTERIISDFRELFCGSSDRHHRVLWENREVFVVNTIRYCMECQEEMLFPQFLYVVEGKRYCLYGCKPD